MSRRQSQSILPPDPYSELVTNMDSFTPEQKLLFGVVVRAILDVQRPYYWDSCSRSHCDYFKRDAEAWITSSSEEQWSFRWVAAHLSNDVNGFQSGVAKFIRRKDVWQAVKNTYAHPFKDMKRLISRRRSSSSLGVVRRDLTKRQRPPLQFQQIEAGSQSESPPETDKRDLATGPGSTASPTRQETE